MKPCEWTYQESVGRWDIEEVRLKGPEAGNPFVEQWVRGTFCGAGERVKADGFYDGDGEYAVRFMPAFEGECEFSIEASFLERPRKGGLR